jgi:hormone-sensitive lipase
VPTSAYGFQRASSQCEHQTVYVCFQTCHLDPMLDDSISFAQRLLQLGRTVHCDVLDGLPHGFLNFVLVSPEAKAGSDLCIRRLREILFVTPDDGESPS